MDNYLLPDLLRKIYFSRLNGTMVENEVYNNAYKELNLLFFKKFNIKDDLTEFIHDLFYVLLDNFDKSVSSKNSFWEQVSEANVVNNKRIISYLFTILSSWHFKRNLSTDERNLDSAIKSITKTLLEDGTIMPINTGYGFNNGANKSKYSNEVISFNSWILSKGSSIDHVKLKQLLIFIFKNLENFYFSTSDLLKIVIENSDRGRVEIINPNDSASDNDDDSLSFEETQVDYENNLPSVELENLDSLKVIWADLTSSISEEKLELYSLIFILKFYYNKTYKEILKISDNITSQSTIDNYYKKFCMIIYTTIKQNDLGQNDGLLNEFCFFLIDKYDAKLKEVLENE